MPATPALVIAIALPRVTGILISADEWEVDANDALHGGFAMLLGLFPGHEHSLSRLDGKVQQHRESDNGDQGREHAGVSNLEAAFETR
jgi:hypothetical protein